MRRPTPDGHTDPRIDASPRQLLAGAAVYLLALVLALAAPANPVLAAATALAVVLAGRVYRLGRRRRRRGRTRRLCLPGSRACLEA
ncbi:hypothetical protein [Halosegnis sp.]|uniref:hypothetical protein n=1 Tax=Halosegnis sp. TaxID=2864959 RepID=UPI0035D4FBA2